MSTTLTIQNDIDRLRPALANLAEAIHTAGKIVVEIVDKHHDAIVSLQVAFPEVPQSMWSRLERVGRGVMDGRVAIGCKYAWALERLPLSEQKRALDDPVDLLLPNGETTKIVIRNATAKQARQLIGDNGIRNIEQQAAYINGLAVKKTTPRLLAPITYDLKPKRGEVEFIGSAPGRITLSKADLLDILRKLG
jgi:hypothetical protein